ncbi:hypothetical protein PanWU01x14_097190 [Parasponia andersonii]|uniref:Uncharacterized protein n=1 Tax=Parasponia andersonii TaxID=3476 RepID=A0A2P5D4B7_PARAD|nr:hypothetical protein PanWU01x14_097190 [Parasponia andersonii]
MLVIKDKFEQNLKTIEELEELIQKIHYQDHRKQRFLIAEIVRERRKHAHQAQILADLQHNKNKLLPPDTITTTRDIILSGTEGYHCDVGTSYGTMLDNELEKELAKWGGFLDEEESGNSLCVKNEAKDLLEAEVEIRQQIKALAVLPGHV